MPEVENKNNAAGGEQGVDNSKGTSETDAFGQPTVPQAPAPKEEGAGEGEKKGEGEGEKGKKEGEKKEYPPIPDDHPTIVDLKKQIEDIKREYGGNLSGQRGLIKTLEDKIEALTKGGKPAGDEAEEDVLFKKEDIKWSKDLTKEEREEMTETEIKQMDEIARMKEAQNKMYADSKKRERDGETQKVEDLQSLVKSHAKELAKKEDGTVDTDLANQIIESAKQFNLTGLDEATVKQRVETARKLLPDYKPPQEQINKKGKPVDGTKPSDDPFGVDKIVEDATKGSDGKYSL